MKGTLSGLLFWNLTITIFVLLSGIFLLLFFMFNKKMLIILNWLFEKTSFF